MFVAKLLSACGEVRAARRQASVRHAPPRRRQRPLNALLAPRSAGRAYEPANFDNRSPNVRQTHGAL
jgi:hypothetical protein